MSTRQIGNGFENTVMEMAEALGYATFAARGSRGPIDIVCFDNHHRDGDVDDLGLRPLVIQVGTTNKAIHRTLIELEEAARPIGSLPLVARRHCKGRGHAATWTFHAAGETKILSFPTLAAALA